MTNWNTVTFFQEKSGWISDGKILCSQYIVTFS